MYTYRTEIYTDPSATIVRIEQPRASINKRYLLAIRDCCIDTLHSLAENIIYYVIYRDNTPIMFGHVSTYNSFLFDTPTADWWLARWGNIPGEFRKTITLEVLA